ncbi:MAG: hypothetical protein Q9212_005291 [Teloschistes hypoglaucus]
MDIMEEWLSTTIQRDLCQVLEHDSTESRALYEDDGSNIRIRLSVEGIVQIIKWANVEDPLQVLVSDSMTMIKAIIASGAATQHERKTGQPVTQGTIGNIIQLHDAEIVATRLGPKPSWITLLIKRFSVTGSGPSDQIGSPRHFEITPAGSELLGKIAELRGSADRPAPSQSAGSTSNRASPAHPGLGDSALTDDHRQDSQQFLSQVPAAYRSRDHGARTNVKGLHGLRLPQNGGKTSGRAASKPHANQSEALVEIMKSRNKADTKSEVHAEMSTTMGPQAENVRQAESPLGPEAMVVKQPPQRVIETPSSTKSRNTSPRKSLQRPVASKRIRSRDVRISKGQQELLGRDDSWLPPEPGRRGPVANIPISILEEFTRKVQHRAKQPSSIDDREASSPESDRGASQGSESKDNEDSDSDAPIPWGSSPVQDQRRELPPDSSLPDAEDLDLESHTQQLNHATPASDSHLAEASQRSAPVASMSDLISSASTSAKKSKSKHNVISSATVQVDKSDSESDLEMSIPLKLSEQASSNHSMEYTQEVPATAIQPSEPKVQVDRTPHQHLARANPRIESRRYSSSGDDASPPKRRRLAKLDAAHDGADSLIGVHELEIEETVLPRMTQVYPLKALEAPLNEQFAKDSATDSELPTTDLISDQAQQGSNGESERQAKLRRKADSPVLSPYVTTKRRRIQRSPLAFGFSQDEYPKEDPSIAMRKYREDFFASRKNSLAESRKSPSNEADPRVPSTPGIPEGVDSTRTATPVAERTDVPGPSSLALGASAVACSADISHEDDVRSSQHISNDTRSQVSGAADGPMSVWPHRQNIDEPASIEDSLSSSELAAQQRFVASIEQQEQPSLLLTQSVHTDLHSVSTNLETNSKSGTSQQTHSSGQAQSLPELMTPALSVSEIAHSSPHLDHLALPQESPRIMDMFARFQSTYSEYSGTRGHFNGMCKKIDQLVRAGRMEHKSLWDDFIIRHKTDYPQYLQRCVDNVEDAKAYEQFYHNEIDEPRFTKRIIQPGTLSEVIPPSQDHFSPTILDHGQARNGGAGANNALSPGSRTRSHSQKEIKGEPTSHEPFVVAGDNDEGSPDQRQRPAAGEKALPPLSMPGMSQPINLTRKRSSSALWQAQLHQPNVSPSRSIQRTPRRIPWNESPSHVKSGSSGNSRQATKISKTESTDHASPVKRSEEPTNAGSSSKDSKEKPLAIQRGPGKRAKEHSRIAKGKQREEKAAETDEWWKDEDTPFRQFSKKYHTIKPGRGNAWAQEMKKGGEKKQEGKGKEPEASHHTRKSGDRSRGIDVMKWHL